MAFSGQHMAFSGGQDKWTTCKISPATFVGQVKLQKRTSSMQKASEHKHATQHVSPQGKLRRAVPQPQHAATKEGSLERWLKRFHTGHKHNQSAHTRIHVRTCTRDLVNKSRNPYSIHNRCVFTSSLNWKCGSRGTVHSPHTRGRPEDTCSVVGIPGCR